MPTALRKHFTKVDGTEIHWAEAGDGPPLLLLHGLSDSHRTWDRVAPALSRTRRVLMPDLPGHGLSGRPDASYSLAWYAGIVAAWLDALDVGEADVVGHSYGGGVAQWLLLERGARVRRLGLVAAGGLGRDVSLGLRLAAVPFVVEHAGQPFMGVGTRLAMRSLGGFTAADAAESGWMNARPGSARALARTVRDVIDVRGQRRHFTDRAHELGALPPMALFWGDRDPVIPVSHALELVRVLQHVGLTRFAGCGHFPHRECPPAFLRALEELVGERAEPAPAARRVFAVPASPPRPNPFVRAWRWLARALARPLN